MNLKKCLGNLLFITTIFYQFIFNELYANSSLEEILKREKLSTSDVKIVQKILADKPGESIRSFLSVIRDNDFPDRSRWLSLVLVGKTMGTKSSDLMVKYLSHPNWMIRSAAVKSLKSLKIVYPIKEYRELLSDRSYVIREQALDTISVLKIYGLKMDVLKMLGDSSNYINTKSGMKPSEVVKKIISTLSSLKVKEAIPALRKLQSSSMGAGIRGDINQAIKKIIL